MNEQDNILFTVSQEQFDKLEQIANSEQTKQLKELLESKSPWDENLTENENC